MLIPLMNTKRRGGDICGGERGGLPVCHLHIRLTKLSLLLLTAKLHEPERESQHSPQSLWYWYGKTALSESQHITKQLERLNILCDI